MHSSVERMHALWRASRAARTTLLGSAQPDLLTQRINEQEFIFMRRGKLVVPPRP